MIPTTRAEIQTRILQDLGEPVIKVNVAQEQLDNAIDDALQYWSEFHVDGQERSFIRHQITQQDLDNGYVTLPTHVFAVLKVFDPRGLGANFSWASFQFELLRDTIFDAGRANNLSSYVVTRQYLAELEFQLSPTPQFDFRYHRRRLYIFDDMKAMYKVGDYAVFEVMGYLFDQAENNIWRDRTLRKLATAYTKKVWGQDLKKFSGVTLPSGITLNGEQIYQDAIQEINELEAYIVEQQEPLGIIIG